MLWLCRNLLISVITSFNASSFLLVWDMLPAYMSIMIFLHIFLIIFTLFYYLLIVYCMCVICTILISLFIWIEYSSSISEFNINFFKYFKQLCHFEVPNAFSKFTGLQSWFPFHHPFSTIILCPGIPPQSLTFPWSHMRLPLDDTLLYFIFYRTFDPLGCVSKT